MITLEDKLHKLRWEELIISDKVLPFESVTLERFYTLYCFSGQIVSIYQRAYISRYKGFTYPYHVKVTVTDDNAYIGMALPLNDYKKTWVVICET